MENQREILNKKNTVKLGVYICNKFHGYSDKYTITKKRLIPYLGEYEYFVIAEHNGEESSRMWRDAFDVAFCLLDGAELVK